MDELPLDELEPEGAEEECSGFVESVVLAMKVCFYEEDMRQILIERRSQDIVYHHRACSRQGKCSIFLGGLCFPGRGIFHICISIFIGELIYK